jgi:hypothetical protein
MGDAVGMLGSNDNIDIGGDAEEVFVCANDDPSKENSAVVVVL